MIMKQADRENIAGFYGENDYLMGAWIDKMLRIGQFYWICMGLVPSEFLWRINLVGLLVSAFGLDLGPKVQVPQKLEKACLHGGGH